MAIKWNGEHVGLCETQCHYINYFKGIPHFKEYRLKMMTSDTKELAFTVLRKY